MEKRSTVSFGTGEVTLGVISLIGLYIVSRFSYPIFHTLAELFSIIIGFGLFMLIWNSRRFIDNNYLVFISIAYLFIAGLDLIHTLAYKGMDVFAGYGANLPTQLWIAARYAESLALLAAPFYIKRRLRINVVLTGFTVFFSLLLAAIFSGVFPDCYIDGTGLTPFKVASEYVISGILLGSLILLLRKREGFDREVLVMIALSIIATIGSELAFTFYVGVYDFSNLIGHYLKIISFYLIYKAVIETGLTKPYNLMFRNLKQNEEALEKARDRAQSYLDLVGGFMLALNADQTVTMINRRGCEILGYEAPEIMGKKWFDTFVPERMRDEVKDVFSGLMAGNVQENRTFENSVLTRSGEERIISWQNSVLWEGEGRITGTLSSGEDITDRKRAEEALRAHTSDLEAANKELEDFTYTVSHDLRAPLRAIDGFSRMLLRDQGTNFTEDTQRKLNVIRSNVLRMGQLIDDLLAFSRLGRTAMTLSYVDMELLVKETWNELCTQDDGNQKSLRMSALPLAFGDRTLVRQVLSNLLSNAVKYSRSKGSAVIEIGGEDNGEETLYYVKDNGVGFDMRYYDKLFGVFQRLHSDEEFEGTGVGLAIVKRIVHRHGGTVWAEGKVNEGAAFYFTFPAKNGREIDTRI